MIGNGPGAFYGQVTRVIFKASRLVSQSSRGWGVSFEGMKPSHIFSTNAIAPCLCQSIVLFIFSKIPYVKDLGHSSVDVF